MNRLVLFSIHSKFLLLVSLYTKDLDKLSSSTMRPSVTVVTIVVLQLMTLVISTPLRTVSTYLDDFQFT
jgi:hypothetical protein